MRFWERRPCCFLASGPIQAAVASHSRHLTQPPLDLPLPAFLHSGCHEDLPGLRSPGHP
jgi:hypothetical protein